MNRRTYVVEVLVIFAAYLAIGFALQSLGWSHAWLDVALTAALFLYIARAFSGRTHDIGHTDYWTILPLGMFLTGWLIQLLWNDAPSWAELAAHSVWIVSLLIPLMFEGSDGTNQFGRAPAPAVELKKITNIG